MIKAVFIDFDGTIYSHVSDCIPKSTKEGLKKLQENNILVFLCTGRSIGEMKLTTVDNFTFDGSIFSNGQIIMDKEKVLKDYPVKGELKDRILELFNNKEISVFLSTNRGAYINTVKEATIKVHETFNFFPRVDEYKGENFYGASVFVSNDFERNKVNELKDIADVTFWNKYAVDVVPIGVSKFKAIKEVCDIYNFDISETMAIGDSGNDYEMVKGCGVGVAMGNSIDKLKEIANYVTDDIDDDGLYNALKHYELI